MVSVSQIQEKIETKIFVELGSTVVRSPYLSSSTSKWGDADITYDSNQNITAIPYNLIANREDFQPFGDMDDGDVIMAFRYNQSLSTRDKITFDSKTYLIKQIEKIPLNDVFLIQLARMSIDQA